jgi:hypothetical protein
MTSLSITQNGGAPLLNSDTVLANAAFNLISLPPWKSGDLTNRDNFTHRRDFSTDKDKTGLA